MQVAHPHVAEQVSLDLAVLEVAAHIVTQLVPSLRYVMPVKCVQDFRESMEKQVHYQA